MQLCFLVHLLFQSLAQEDFRTGFTFTPALTKKKYLPIELFSHKIGPNWRNGLCETSVQEEQEEEYSQHSMYWFWCIFLKNTAQTMGAFKRNIDWLFNNSIYYLKVSTFPMVWAVHLFYMVKIGKNMITYSHFIYKNECIFMIFWRNRGAEKFCGAEWPWQL